MRLIDADAMIDRLDTDEYGMRLPKAVVGLTKVLLDDAPSIDIVRCKECTYWRKGKCFNLNGLNKIDGVVNADDFCSYGEREGEWLEELEAYRQQGEWIPCSERLPSEDEQDPELGVIVTLGNGYSGLQYDWYHDGHWYDWDGFVVAWMPLPKPWKGADDEG